MVYYKKANTQTGLYRHPLPTQEHSKEQVDIVVWGHPMH